MTIATKNGVPIIQGGRIVTACSCCGFACESPAFTGCRGRIDYSYGPVFSNVPTNQEIAASRQTYQVPFADELGVPFAGYVRVRFCGGGDDGIAINGVRKSLFGQPVPESAFLTLQPGDSFTVGTWNDGGPAAGRVTICFSDECPCAAYPQTINANLTVSLDEIYDSDVGDFCRYLIESIWLPNQQGNYILEYDGIINYQNAQGNIFAAGGQTLSCSNINESVVTFRDFFSPCNFGGLAGNVKWVGRVGSQILPTDCDFWSGASSRSFSGTGVLDIGDFLAFPTYRREIGTVNFAVVYSTNTLP